jgi:hypothetical protein
MSVLPAFYFRLFGKASCVPTKSFKACIWAIQQSWPVSVYLPVISVFGRLFRCPRGHLTISSWQADLQNMCLLHKTEQWSLPTNNSDDNCFEYLSLQSTGCCSSLYHPIDRYGAVITGVERHRPSVYWLCSRKDSSIRVVSQRPRNKSTSYSECSVPWFKYIATSSV